MSSIQWFNLTDASCWLNHWDWHDVKGVMYFWFLLFFVVSLLARAAPRQRQIRRYKVGGPCPERFEPALRTYIPNYEDSCSQRRIFISKELYVEEPLPDPRHVTTLLNVQGERGFMSLSPLAV